MIARIKLTWDVNKTSSFELSFSHNLTQFFLCVVQCPVLILGYKIFETVSLQLLTLLLTVPHPANHTIYKQTTAEQSKQPPNHIHLQNLGRNREVNWSEVGFQESLNLK